MIDWGVKEGARLKELRMKKGFTVPYVAKKIECGESSIYKWERGYCAPRRKFLHDMAFLYNVSIEDITSRTDDDNAIETAIPDVNISIENSVSYIDDSIDAFLKEEIEKVPDNVTNRIKKSELYDFYSVFCQNRNEISLSKRTFYSTMRKNGFGEIKSNNGKEFFKGIRYKKDRIFASLIAEDPFADTDQDYAVAVSKKADELIDMMAKLSDKSKKEMVTMVISEYAQYIFDWNKALEGFCDEKS